MIFSLLALQAPAAPQDPSLRITAQPGAAESAVRIEASDTEGLDSLEIACKEVNSTWHSELSGAALTRTYMRTFSLQEIFPSLAGRAGSVRLDVTVRSTRGQTATTAIQVPLSQ